MIWSSIFFAICLALAVWQSEKGYRTEAWEGVRDGIEKFKKQNHEKSNL
jgi:preprotein translocase subunit SecG